MMLPVSTTEGGDAMSLPPTVNFIPAPPPANEAPAPFLSKGAIARTTKTTKNVLIRNEKCVVEDSEAPMTSGDEPGFATAPMKQGLKSRTQLGKLAFGRYSSKVKMEGKGVVCLTAVTKHNSENTVGMIVSPSQTVVLADM